MTLIYYIHQNYNILIKPGKKHDCPICHRNKSLSVKKDALLAKCFKCGNYFVVTKNGVYDSTYRPSV